ncbi:MAG: HAD family phosphatase [Nanoarchaeota archaeon]|nr:HAD family phosphatase [Nanoarchaeota archaeon]
MFKNIKAIIYDLDGTIIDSEKLHERAWASTGKQFGIEVTPQMLLDQKGRPDDATSLAMLGQDRTHEIEEFRLAKLGYSMKGLKQDIVFSNFSEAVQGIEAKKIITWICTSAYEAYTRQALDTIDDLHRYKDKTVWREMYGKGKPNPDPLLVTMEMIVESEKLSELKPEECIYVGDAYSDYGAAKAAGMGFIYYLPDPENDDSRIPQDVPRIRDHNEIVGLVNRQ